MTVSKLMAMNTNTFEKFSLRKGDKEENLHEGQKVSKRSLKDQRSNGRKRKQFNQTDHYSNSMGA